MSKPKRNQASNCKYFLHILDAAGSFLAVLAFLVSRLLAVVWLRSVGCPASSGGDVGVAEACNAESVQSSQFGENSNNFVHTYDSEEASAWPNNLFWLLQQMPWHGAVT